MTQKMTIRTMDEIKSRDIEVGQIWWHIVTDKRQKYVVLAIKSGIGGPPDTVRLGSMDGNIEMDVMFGTLLANYALAVEA